MTSIKVLIFFLIPFTLFGVTTQNTLDYREGKQINTCYQYAEQYNNIWYFLSEQQRNEALSLELIKHTPKQVTIGGGNLMFYTFNEGFDIYKGRTESGRIITVKVRPLDRTTLILILEGLHPKKFNCKIKEIK